MNVLEFLSCHYKSFGPFWVVSKALDWTLLLLYHNWYAHTSVALTGARRFIPHTKLVGLHVCMNVSPEWLPVSIADCSMGDGYVHAISFFRSSLTESTTSFTCSSIWRQLDAGYSQQDHYCMTMSIAEKVNKFQQMFMRKEPHKFPDDGCKAKPAKNKKR